jgi:hypothetical protein
MSYGNFTTLHKETKQYLFLFDQIQYLLNKHQLLGRKEGDTFQINSPRVLVQHAIVLSGNL